MGYRVVFQAQTPRDVTRSLRVVFVRSTRGNITDTIRHAFFLENSIFTWHVCRSITIEICFRRGAVTMLPVCQHLAPTTPPSPNFGSYLSQPCGIIEHGCKLLSPCVRLMSPSCSPMSCAQCVILIKGRLLQFNYHCTGSGKRCAAHTVSFSTWFTFG